MTDDYGTPPSAPGAPVGLSTLPPQTPQPPTTASPATVDGVRHAARVAAVLAVLGAALGPLWAWWSGPQQRAYVIAPGKLYPFDEVETMAAADGRYFAIVAGVGLLAPIIVWLTRPERRGALPAGGMAVGGLAGAALMAWVGHLTGGGSSGHTAGTTISHMPLSLHMRGLLFVEPAFATLLYCLFVAFAARDDLGLPDPVRDRVSVRGDDHAQHGRGDSDRPSPLQQADLPPQ